MFTPEEEKVIKLIEVTGKWDSLTSSLTLLVPCYVIMGLCLYFSSVAGVIIGMGLYMFFRLRYCYICDKMGSVLRSVVSKMKKEIGHLNDTF